MSAFRAVLNARSKLPVRFIDLPPESFCESWHERPQEVVRVGLRRISDTNVQTARAESAKYAVNMHDDQEGRVEAFNDALMRWTIVYGTCEPENVEVPALLFQGSEDVVRDALTSQAIRYCWDEYERYHVETSPAVVPLTDAQIEDLAMSLLSAPLPSSMSRGVAMRVRKLLSFVATELELSSSEPTE